MLSLPAFLCMFNVIVIVKTFTTKDLDNIRDEYSVNNYDDSENMINILLGRHSEDVDSSILLNNILSIDYPFGMKIISKLLTSYEPHSLQYNKSYELLLRNMMFKDGLKLSLIETIDIKNSFLSTGSPSAQVVEAFTSSIGITKNYSSYDSILYGTFSMYGENIDGMMLMARRYKDGLNVEENCDYSYDIYQKITKKVFRSKRIFDSFSVDQHLLMNDNSEISLVSDNNWLNYLQFMASNGKDQLSFVLGELYYFGLRGITRDWTEAKRYFEQALSNNQFEAAVYLARIYAEGNSKIPRNLHLAYKFFELASNKGIKSGTAGIAIMKLFGLAVERDLIEARRIFQTVAGEHGSVEANAFYGIMKMHGLGGNVDVVGALESFMIAAKNGSSIAVYFISIIHRRGLGVFSSCQLAIEFIKVVLERNVYGRLLNEAFNRFELKSNVDESAMMYLWMAEMGIQSAQINAAYILSKYKLSYMNSLEQQKQLAFKYWYLSSGKGNTAIEVNIGDCYYYGEGIDKNYSLAAFYYRLAADGGSVEGYFNLAYMYENGLGLPEDFVMSKNYYDSAKALSDNKWSYIPINMALTKLFLKTHTSKLSISLILSKISQMFDSYDKLTCLTGFLFVVSIALASFAGLKKLFQFTTTPNHFYQ